MWIDATLHGSQVMVFPHKVLQPARLHLLEDALLDEVWHTILSVGNHPHSWAPLLLCLGLFGLGLFGLGLLLLGLFEEDLQVGEFLSHLVVDQRPQLGLDDREHRLARQIHIMALVEVVALVPVLPHLRVLLDLLHELLDHSTCHPRLVRVVFCLICTLAFLASFALGLVILGFGVLALGFAIFALLSLILLWLFVEALVELIELVGELQPFFGNLAVVEDPLPSLLQELRFDV
mmetsp:Transcript_11624/g.18523  ORF Transcript_11624/g.18523 Transcript_11624/m.18523 type:complete len:234 (+) Transcript_11624:990-1691(+)